MTYNNSANNVNINQPVRALTSTSNLVLQSDVILEVTTSSGASVLLPTASRSGFTNNVGKLFIVKDAAGTAGTNNITISSTGNSIDGSSSLKIATNYGFYQLISDGTNYYSIASPNQSYTPSLKINVFSTGGSYTPSTDLQFAQIEVIGGGGGGGGTNNPTASTGSGAGGGGGGEYARGIFSAAVLLGSSAVTIGAGGAAGGSNATGGTGGISSLGSLISAGGGRGGHPSVSTPLTSSGSGSGPGGLGGSGGTGGNFRVQGMPGAFGVGWHSASGSFFSECGGNGGSTFYGGGGLGQTGTANGIDGTGFGGGGSGGSVANHSGNFVGGNGKSGAVIITEFIFSPSNLTTTSFITWNTITSSAQTLAPSNGYITTFSGLTTLTLPLSAPAGTQIQVQGAGAGGWTILQNAGQQIFFGNQATTADVTGTLSSTNQYDGLQLLAVSSSQFVVLNSIGNFTLV